MENAKTMKSGFVSIVGKPNSGKSTLINQIFKNKISIATPKQNTTRNRINAIYNDDESQISFIDTPGFLKVKNKLDEHMVDMIRESIKDVDIVLFISNVMHKLDVEYLKTIELIGTNVKKILVLNKVDLIPNNQFLFEKISEYNDLEIFDEIVPISAIKDKNIDTLLKVIKNLLPIDIAYYPIDQSVTYTKEFYASEIIREKILFLLQDEIPHEIFVKITDFEDELKKIHIRAEIIIARESLKMIIIGKNGEMIKSIGTKSREELEKYFNKKIYLELFVKIRKDWKNQESIIKTFY